MYLVYEVNSLKDLEYASIQGVKCSKDDILNIYHQAAGFMESTRKVYQESWDKIGRKFSEYIKEQTGYDWYYPTYRCLLSVIHKGISNWGTEPLIIRAWNENPYTQRLITAHELIISHYFEIYNRNYSKYGLTDNQVWALAEIAAWSLTAQDVAIKNFWPWECNVYNLDHNYPQLVELQTKLWPIFLARYDFEDYIFKSFKVVKKYNDLRPDYTPPLRII